MFNMIKKASLRRKEINSLLHTQDRDRRKSDSIKLQHAKVRFVARKTFNTRQQDTGIGNHHFNSLRNFLAAWITTV